MSVMNTEQTHPNASSSGGPPEEQRHAGTPTDLRVGTAVALSSVAKYWVLTNLFPGPIPQVSVYGLHPPRPCDGSKPQDGLSQHQQHCLPALPPPPGVNMATDTMSLLPQHPHSQVAGLHMDQGPLDNSDKNKIDKGTCTVERCGDNQVHCQVQCDLQLVNSVQSHHQANEQMASTQQNMNHQQQHISQPHHQQQQQHLQQQQQQHQQQIV